MIRKDFIPGLGSSFGRATVRTAAQVTRQAARHRDRWRGRRKEPGQLVAQVLPATSHAGLPEGLGSCAHLDEDRLGLDKQSGLPPRFTNESPDQIPIDRSFQ